MMPEWCPNILFIFTANMGAVISNTSDNWILTGQNLVLYASKSSDATKNVALVWYNNCNFM